MADQTTDDDAGRFACDALDRVLHERARLGILAALVTTPGGLLFSDLKKLCALTDGNLSQHLEVLRLAGIIEVWKGFENRRPQTLCRLTAGGRQRFVEYLARLEPVIRDTRAKASRHTDAAPAAPQGWRKV